MPGPLPKRTEERRRRNAPDGVQVSRAPGAENVRIPPASQSWHPIARDWYRSLRESGQARFYEPSDWATARLWAQIVSDQLASGRPSSQMMAAWQNAATELLTTEGARRKSRIELERLDPKVSQVPAGVKALSDYRDVLGA